MKRYYVADIEWISHDKGGRKSIPKEGTRYCPLIRICKEDSRVDWSIDFVCPDFSIEKNVSYGLYEGNKHVAELRILETIE